MRLFCLAAALITANAFAGEKVLLRLNLQVNQRSEYQIKMKMAAANLGNLSGTFHIAERTVKASNTSYTQSIYVAGNSFKAEGELDATKAQFDQLKNLNFQKILSSNAKPVSIAGISANAFGSAIDLVFSDQPVGTGDTWSNPVKLSDEFGDNEVVFKLLSLTETEAKIEANLKKNDALAFSEPYLFIIDRATGRTKYSRGAIKATTSGTTIEVKYEMRMIVPSQPYQFQSGDM
jgi:hypothetical protein